MLASGAISNELVLENFVIPMNVALKSCNSSVAIDEALEVAGQAMFCAKKLAQEKSKIASEIKENNKYLYNSLFKLGNIIDGLKQGKQLNSIYCSTMKHSLSKSTCRFCTAMALIILVVLGLTILYFIHFHGPLSDASPDWANMSTFITGFGTMLFTGLNVWVVWCLTKEMNVFTTSGKKRELQANAINCFNRYMYDIFQPLADVGECEVKTDCLLQTEDAFRRLKVYSKALLSH